MALDTEVAKRPKADAKRYGEKKSCSRQVLLTQTADDLLTENAEAIGISAGEAIERLIRMADWEAVKRYGED